MEFISRYIGYFNKCFSHKRSRSESKVDSLIDLKRKKIDFNEFKEEEISKEETNNDTSRINNIPKSEKCVKFEINDPKLIFRTIISQSDENSSEILTSKLKIMKEAIEIGEILLDKQGIAKSEPISNDQKIPQNGFCENFESSSDLEIIEVPPSLKMQEENKFYEKDKEMSLDSLKEIENIWNDERYEEIWGKIKDSILLYKDIKCLQFGEFINDEVVNAYLKLLLPFPKNVHIFNSFFYEYISEMLSTRSWNIKKLKRILKKQGIDRIFSKKYLIFPINLNRSHWVAAQINNKGKCIEYYDSFGENSFERVCETINEFICQLEGEEWNHYEYKAMQVPQQSTCWDCGIFMIQTIRCLVENREFDFEQAKIDFIRKIIALELKNQTLYRLI